MGKRLVRRAAAVALALALAGGVALPARARGAQEPSYEIMGRIMRKTRMTRAENINSYDTPLSAGRVVRIVLPTGMPDALLCGFSFSPMEMRQSQDEESYVVELTSQRYQDFFAALSRGLPEQVRALGMQAQDLNVLDVQCDQWLRTIRLMVDAPADQRWNVQALLPLMCQWGQRSVLMQAFDLEEAISSAKLAVEIIAQCEGEPLMLERVEMPMYSLFPSETNAIRYTGNPVQVTPLPAPAGFTSFTLSPQAQALYFDDAEVLAQYGEDVGTDRDARFTLSSEQLAAFRAALTEQFRVQCLRRALAEDTLVVFDVQVLGDFSHLIFYANDQPYRPRAAVLDESSAVGWAMQYALAMQKMLGAPGMAYSVEAYVLLAHDRIWPDPLASEPWVIPSGIMVRDYLFMYQ